MFSGIIRIPADVFPAQAGVILEADGLLDDTDRVPRTGGGDPGINVKQTGGQACSPHRRG